MRTHVIAATIGLAFCCLVARSFYLQFADYGQGRFEHILKKQYRSEHSLAPYRGSIDDRMGRPLAISIEKPSYFINPRDFAASPSQQQKLAHAAGISAHALSRAMNKNSYFAWLKRKASELQSEAIQSLQIDKIYKVYEPSRFYPGGDLASNLIGYVGLDHKGMAGIEAQFHQELAGPSTKVKITKDARGRSLIMTPEIFGGQRQGLNIRLTIDRVIQSIAEESLDRWVGEAQAKGGFALVMDPQTGALLAVANHPRFDPNRPIPTLSATRNQALNDTFEPGSVVKPFVVGEAFEHGLVDSSTLFDCKQGRGEAGGVRFYDSHKPPKDLLNATETLIHSSNVCIFEIANLLGKDGLFAGLQKVGVGAKSSGLGYPGQEFGYITKPSSWRPIRFANISFGQGLTMTGLEIAQAYALLANGGRQIKPSIIKSVHRHDGSLLHEHLPTMGPRVYSEHTVAFLRSAMRESVLQGAIKAQLPRHSSAGKTGTSQKIDPNTKAYSKSLHRALFAGFAPAHQSRLVVVVMIDEPGQSLHYGALWAAPAFAEIADQSLRYLNVPPDLDSNKSLSLKDQGQSTRL